MEKVFGIDLGTTYSCIACIDEFDKPRVLKNAEGMLTTPSVVYFESDEAITVGAAAKEYSKMYPEKVVSFIKREMGREGYAQNVNGVDMKPEEISSRILMKVVQDAEDTLRMEGKLEEDEHIRDVVITCPAYFGIAERAATREAGVIAGLHVLDIINEPTAAAIDYGVMENSQGRTVLVYDLGGGTFDVTMIHVEPGEIKVICTGGDHNLGGCDWDERVITYVAEQFRENGGTQDDILEDEETLQQLSLDVEKAKKFLSQPKKEKTAVSVNYKGDRVSVELTREKFDALTEDLLTRTISLTRDTLKEAEKKGYHQSDIDCILLVGGSSYMPQVMSRVKAEFGLETKLFDPDESVAKGAAIYARTKKRGPGLPDGTACADTQIVNVSSRSFGTEAYESDFSDHLKIYNIILRNAELPAAATRSFCPRSDNQSRVRFSVKESITSEEIVDPEMGKDVGYAVLELPAGITRDTEIKVTFRLDESGLLHLHAREMKEGREVNAEFQIAGALTEQERSEALRRARKATVS